MHLSRRESVDRTSHFQLSSSNAKHAARARKVGRAVVRFEPLECRTLLSSYTILDLGTLGGADSQANAINDNGQVTGQADIPGGQPHAFVYANGSMNDLGALSGTDSSYGWAINSAEQIAGGSYIGASPGSGFYGFIDSTGSLQGFAGNELLNQPTGINSSNVVCGFGPWGGAYQPYTYDPASGLQEIPLLSGESLGNALGINDMGQVIGGDYNGSWTGYVYNVNTHTLRALPGGPASAINNNGQIAGDTPGQDAYLYNLSSATITMLGDLGGGQSNSRAINGDGAIVGDSLLSSGEDHAFLYSSGVMCDLNTLISAGSGWVLNNATGINDSGQIVGYGTINGNTHAFLLTPKVSTASVTLAVTESTVTYGRTVALSATLTSNGQPVGNESITFSIDDSVIGTATTDQNGIAALPFATGSMSVGNHVVQATFAGDSAYASGNATSTLVVTDQNIQGLVWGDFNDDGNVDFGETGISGVSVTIIDSNGQTVSQTTTDSNGLYAFNHVLPGTYTIAEGGNPAGYVEGRDALGEITDLSGNQLSTTIGNNSLQDIFSQVVIGSDQNAINYNFGEQPAAGSTVSRSQAAGIGFWQNKNGQALILHFSAIGSWLADTLPQTFGGLATASPRQVATLYQQQFVLKDKLDAQFMATALNVYASSGSLGGSAAAYYGFAVSQYGLGDSTWNVGSDGAAFGVADESTLTVIQILQDWDQQASKTDKALRTMALDVFGGINGTGGI